MTPEAFHEAVTTDNQTALSRLGSSKALYAATDGEMDSQPILLAAADAEYHAAETYDYWVETETNDDAAEVWVTTADEEWDHYDQVTAILDDAHDPSDPPPIHNHLRSLEATRERTGAFIGRTIAASHSKDQYTGYFVGQANRDLAQLFRDLGADLETQEDRGLTLLETVCDDEADWNAALDAASTTIQTAYEDYVDTLETMGVNPKPVC